MKDMIERVIAQRSLDLISHFYRDFGYALDGEPLADFHTANSIPAPFITPKLTYRSNTQQALFLGYTYGIYDWMLVVQIANGYIGRMPRQRDAVLTTTAWELPRTQSVMEWVNTFFKDVNWFINHNCTVPPGRYTLNPSRQERTHG